MLCDFSDRLKCKVFKNFENQVDITAYGDVKSLDGLNTSKTYVFDMGPLTFISPARVICSHSEE